jgi:4-hydroxy-4-methyl-2-oxoglutarate aldolase
MTSTRGKIGMRVRAEIERPPAPEAAELAAFGSSMLADGMNRFNAMSPEIRPVHPGWRLAGPAVTVRVRAADNLMVTRAIGLARPGDVLVICTGRHHRNAVWGELTTLAARRQGLAGVVTDGAVRDVELLRKMGFPVFAAAFAAAACDKDGPGEINFPVSVGDAVVMPGDLVVGDDDGIVVVPLADRLDVLAGIRAKLASEERRRRDIEAGIVVPDAVVAAVDARTGS